MTTDCFRNCALVCVDIQEGQRGPNITSQTMPRLWKSMGFTAEDVNAASAYAWEVCLPNAVRVVQASRRAGFPLIFIHWGFRFADGMDLDPEIYETMRTNHGTDPAQWPGHIDQPGSRPAAVLDVQPGEYVLAKSGQDAFTSSNLDFVLRNLGVACLVFVGGHTGACLGKTAQSAKTRGYAAVCIEDATSDARESTRRTHIREVGFDAVMTTAEYLARLDAAMDP